MSSPLANPRFRRLFAAQIISLGGTGLTTVALALLAYDLTGADAGKVLGYALAIKMIAYVAFSPLFGSVARLLPRRVMLISLDLFRAAIVCMLPLVDSIWQIYVLIFLLSAGSAGFTPVFQATIPDILPDEREYTQALSLSRLAYDLENLLSPLAAAAALMVLSYDYLFVANGAAFVMSAALVLTVALPRISAPADNGAGIWRNTTRGVRIYFATPRLRGLLALSLAVAAAGAMVIVNTVVYVRDYLERSESDTAIALAAFGAGSMAIALIMPRMLGTLSDRTPMLAGGCMLAGSLFAGCFMPQFTGLLILWAALGAGYSFILTPAGRLLRRSAQAADRPAIFAAQFALSHACWLITYPLAGLAATYLNTLAAFGLLGLIAAAATASAIYLWPRNELEQEMPAAEQ